MKFTSGFTGIFIKERLLNTDILLKLALTNLKEVNHSRQDCREMLEQTIIFLGGISLRGISFRSAEAFHQAW